jgi:hypothetical protein
MPPHTPSSSLVSLACWALLLVLAGVEPTGAASPRDELLRLVPDDVGVCLVVQDLRSHAAELLGSPFFQAVQRTPLGKSLLASNEIKILAKFDSELAKATGLPWRGLRDEILGDAVVFAFRPGPPGKSDGDQGLFLVRARSARVLAEVVEKLNQTQKATPEFKELIEREHRGVKYFCRVESKGTNFYCLRGPVLLFSSQEAILREAIERSLGESEGEPAGTRQMRELGLEKGLLSVWLNPRVYDAAINERAARGDDPGARTFASVWKAMQGLGLGVEVGRELTLKLAVRARPAELPASWRRFLNEAGKTSELWRAIPDNALLAVSTRIDPAALFDLVGEFMSKESRLALEETLERRLGDPLGKSIIKEVLPALGPDWGLCLAPPTDERSWLPRGWLAVRLGRGGKGDPLDQAVLMHLHSWAVIGATIHNSKKPDQPIRLKTIELDKVTIRHALSAIFPPGVQPALALKGGYLILASSPDVIARFNPTGPLPAPESIPLVRISFRAWCDYLKNHHEALAGALAVRDGISKEQARKSLEDLRGNLELFDRLEVRQQNAPGQATLTIQVQTTVGLRKSEP